MSKTTRLSKFRLTHKKGKCEFRMVSSDSTEKLSVVEIEYLVNDLCQMIAELSDEERAS